MSKAAKKLKLSAPRFHTEEEYAFVSEAIKYFKKGEKEFVRLACLDAARVVRDELIKALNKQKNGGGADDRAGAIEPKGAVQEEKARVDSNSAALAEPADGGDLHERSEGE